jgi:predicted AlkP superfamily phosphohydrolase/phosphomutase
MGKVETKVFIVSLDGATFSVLRPLADQGCLPNLSRMMQRGLSAELESVVPPVTAPAWTSFMTGKPPSKHGIFDFTRFRDSDYSWSINNASHIRGKTLWQILSDKGKHVVVLNLPYTYPPSEINGVVVCGWDAPSTSSVFSSPAGLSAEILQMFPDYKTNLWVSELKPLASDEQFAEFTRRLKAGFEQQAEVALRLLEREEWDVFMVHFQQTDWIQHKLWTYIEQACREPGNHSQKLEATRECYRHFDQFVGKLLERVSPFRATDIVLSDHGFGRLRGNIHPNYYLQEWGYLTPKQARKDKLRGVKDLFRKSRHKKLRQFYRTLQGVGNSLSGSRESTHQSWADNVGDVLGSRGASWDWAKTRAATVYAYQMGFVYVNLKGRGPQGIVAPGTEYDSLIADLIFRFRAIRHPHTGGKLLVDVVRGTDVYPTSAEGVLLPDLVLIPADGYGFSFTVADTPPEMSEEGTHRHNGVLLMQGDSLAYPAALRPNLIDVTPTILHMLGLPVPQDMDGTVLEEVLADGRPVQFEDSDSNPVEEPQRYDPQESELIEQRLKGLGYLE